MRRLGVPADELLFSPAVDRYGARLALVFGNQAAGGLCPYFRAGGCLHCDIGAGEGRAFTLEENRARLRWFHGHYATLLPELAHLVVYDSGSVLNPRELPAEFLDELFVWARTLPALRALSLDSREAFVRGDRLVALAERAGDAIAVRPILGLETSDDHRRDGLLRKRMPRRAVLRAFDEVARAAERVGGGRVGLDVNLVVAGPGTDAASAAEDAAATARFAFAEGGARGLSVDLNLHPYYPSGRGRAAFPDHPRCALPTLVEALEAILRERAERMPAAGLFIGWEDEGHDTEGSQRALDGMRLAAMIDRFNAAPSAELLQSLREPSR